MGFVCGLFVVERLLMRERRGRLKNMDHTGHVRMYQTHKLEIARGREHHFECLARDHRRGADACRAIKGSGTDRKSGAPEAEGQANLSGSQEADSVDLVCIDSPLNAVSSVNPEFVRKEGDYLPSFVLALGADRSVPLSAKGLHEREQCEKYCSREAAPGVFIV